MSKKTLETTRIKRYYDVNTGESYATIPKGKKVAGSNDTMLPEVVVTAKAPKNKPKRSTTMAAYYDRAANASSNNYVRRLNQEYEDERIRRANNWEGVMNLMSPSQYVGAAINAAQGDGGFLENLWYGNSGFVTDDFARNNPRAALMLNMLGDAAVGMTAKNIRTGFARNRLANNYAKELRFKDTKTPIIQDKVNAELPYDWQLAGRAAKDLAHKAKIQGLKLYRTPYKVLGNNSIRRLINKLPSTKDIENLPTDRLNRAIQNKRDYIIRNNPNIEVEYISNRNIYAVEDGADYSYVTTPIELNSDKLPTSTDLQLYGHNNTKYRLQQAKEYALNVNDKIWDVEVANEQRYVPSYSDSYTLTEPIAKHVENVQSMIGDSGIVGGSSYIYGKGYAQGIPGDVEIITTPTRYPELVRKSGGTNSQPHDAFGYKFESNSVSYKGEPVDVQLIQERNGHAYGPVAHEYYRLLYPEEYKAMTEAAVTQFVDNPAAGHTNGATPLSDMEFPISAEELYSKITPEVQERKLLYDMFISDKPKHVQRAYQMLTHPDAAVRAKAVKSMREAIGQHFDDYKLASETYKNLSFNDVAANEAFLEQLGLPKEFAKQPEIMKNIVDRWHIATTTQNRIVSPIFRGVEAFKGRQGLRDAAFSIYAPKNGNASGIGGNTVIHGGQAVIGGDVANIMQQRLTVNPDNIKTPKDLIQQLDRLSKKNDLYNKINDLEEGARTANKRGDVSARDEMLNEKQRLAIDEDYPFYLGKNYTSTQLYAGNNIPPKRLRSYLVDNKYDIIQPEVGGSGVPKLTTATKTLKNMGAEADIIDSKPYAVDLDPTLPYESREAYFDYQMSRKNGKLSLSKQSAPATPTARQQRIAQSLRDAQNRFYISSNNEKLFRQKIDLLNKKIHRADNKRYNIKSNISNGAKVLATTAIGASVFGGIVLLGNKKYKADLEQQIRDSKTCIDNLKNKRYNRQEIKELRNNYGCDNDEQLLKRLERDYDWLMRYYNEQYKD